MLGVETKVEEDNERCSWWRWREEGAEDEVEGDSFFVRLAIEGTACRSEMGREE